MKSNRAVPNTRAALTVGIDGVADAAPLLRLLGQAEVASRVNGQLSWTGTAQRRRSGDTGRMAARAREQSLGSREPPARAVRQGARAGAAGQCADTCRCGRHPRFQSSTAVTSRSAGRSNNGASSARFELQGVAGELRLAGPAAEPRLQFERLDLKRAPAILAVAGAMLPADGEITLDIDDLRHADRSLGARARNPRAAGRGRCVLARVGRNRAAPPGRRTGRARASIASARSSSPPIRKISRRSCGARSYPRSGPPSRCMRRANSAGPRTRRAISPPFSRAVSISKPKDDDSSHQMSANATVKGGQIELANVQGTGPRRRPAVPGQRPRRPAWRAITTSRSTTNGCRSRRAPCRRPHVRASREPGRRCAVRLRAAAGPKSRRRAACNGTAPGMRQD